MSSDRQSDIVSIRKKLNEEGLTVEQRETLKKKLEELLRVGPQETKEANL